MKNNISEIRPAPCSGCGACAAVCPAGAIRLHTDSGGFLIAGADGEKCLGCGLCQRVCPRFSEHEAGLPLDGAALYALQSADAGTVRSCSSGGIAHELAAAALRRGEAVTGTAYDTASDRARHITVRTAEELAALDGSKYLQSDPSVFAGVLRAAKRGERQTVFGTPCQISGLDAAARTAGVRDTLLLVEIFCHGVPSYRLWENELEKIRKKLKTERLDSIRFRYKKDDWHSYCLRADAGDRVFFGEREKELFWQVFFENILLGDACMTCTARGTASRADLRLGDYWGSRFAGRSDGVSAVFALTERGRAEIEGLLSEGRLIRLEAGTAGEMLRAQNMRGYTERERRLHDEAMPLLRSDRADALLRAVRHYRAGQPAKQKMKRFLLRASAVIPSGVRARLRKKNSARKVR